MTKVVHCKKEKYDVYIGRPSEFENPFKIGHDSEGTYWNREQVIELYRCWINQPYNEELRKRMKVELKGKVLGCWCRPNKCHGDVIIEIVGE